MGGGEGGWGRNFVSRMRYKNDLVPKWRQGKTKYKTHTQQLNEDEVIEMDGIRALLTHPSIHGSSHEVGTRRRRRQSETSMRDASSMKYFVGKASQEPRRREASAESTLHGASPEKFCDGSPGTWGAESDSYS